ncbi:MAG: TIGR04282 family arsenosugar biosynthesis glycosyltransferase [Steroidobacteraceae bacterium]
MRNTHLILFAKAPARGLAKTRLIPALGVERTAALAARMLHETLRHAIAARLGTVELCVTPAIEDAQWEGISVPTGIVVTFQGEGDLGARLTRAARRALQCERAVLFLGTDCPHLDSTRLCQAAHHLEHADAVLYPTTDGGYALIGMKQFNARVFADIEWSTASVTATTRARMAELAWSVHLGPTLHDIDEPADLAHLPEHLTPPPP